MNDKLSNVVIELSLYIMLIVLLKSIGEVYVTGFRKTDHIVTIDIARNTDLKY